MNVLMFVCHTCRREECEIKYNKRVSEREVRRCSVRFVVFTWYPCESVNDFVFCRRLHGRHAN
jgi:hypothetical protein